MDILNLSFASSVTVIAKDTGCVLTVSRKEAPHTWGFPGGKRDLGETAIAAAVRELAEETGVVVSEDSLSFVYLAVDEHDHLNTNFLLLCKSDLRFEKKEEDVDVKWMEISGYLEVSAFPNFSREVFKIIEYVKL